MQRRVVGRHQMAKRPRGAAAVGMCPQRVAPEGPLHIGPRRPGAEAEIAQALGDLGVVVEVIVLHGFGLDRRRPAHEASADRILDPAVAGQGPAPPGPPEGLFEDAGEALHTSLYGGAGSPL